ncbi:hypothetical protein J1605_007710 [Eschrichtius robustus]|uniref:EF-hand domain-containing protein n=1 Tax=Eschrichtius robustus TaxID=9764 RepID=A0AB34H0A8_ESCRO|nr:hypothetical protein J1605_007710 [Eschrichtius robustus]MBW02512.1 EF-hand domain-containing protein D1 [Eschrichtius robustus]
MAGRQRGRGATPPLQGLPPLLRVPGVQHRLIEDLESMFKLYDAGRDGFIDLMELKPAAAGERREDSGLRALAKLSEIHVALEGVKGAKDFFEAKVQALSSASKSEAELKAQQDERKRPEDKRKLHQAAFRELKATFST